MTPAAKIKPGDTITWTHYSAPGAGWREPYERTGTVLDGAPTGNGLRNAWWVWPDQPEPGEVLASGVLAVGDASKRDWLRQDGPAKGERYGSSFWRDQPAALTQGAAARQVREARERRAAA